MTLTLTETCFLRELIEDYLDGNPDVFVGFLETEALLQRVEDHIAAAEAPRP